MPRRLVATSILAFAIAHAGVASAAPADKPDKGTARLLMDDGMARMREGDAARALEAFGKAHEIMRVPTTGLALAKAHVALGHLVEALEVASEVAKMPKEKREPAVFDTARKQARDLVKDLRARTPKLRLRLRGGQAVKVMIDDAEIDLALLGDSMPMNPGKHTVTTRSVEGGEGTVEIDLAEREVKELEVQVPTEPAKSVAKTTPPPSKAEPPPRRKREEAEPHAERTALSTGLVYGGFATAAVGLVTGMITGGLTMAKASDITPLCDRDICAPAAREDLEAAKTLAAVATVSVVVGLVGAGAGVLGLSLPKRSAATGALSIDLAPTGLRGTF